MAENKRSFSDIAHMSTLSPEELAEEEQDNGQASDEAEDASAAVTEGTAASDAASDAAAPKEAKVERLVHTDPCYTIAARPNREDLYRFMFSHTYFNIVGVLSILIGLGAIGMVIYSIIVGAGMGQIIMLAVIIVVFLTNSPISLWFKSKKQAEMMEDVTNVITYSFSGVGFDMSRGENEYASYKWEDMYKVREGKTGIYIYLARNRAFVLPKNDIGTELEGFKAMLAGHLAAKKCRLK